MIFVNIGQMMFAIRYGVHIMDYTTCTLKTILSISYGVEPFYTVSAYYSEMGQTSVPNMLLGSILKNTGDWKLPMENTVLYNNRAAICKSRITSLSPKSPALHKLKIFKS